MHAHLPQDPTLHLLVVLVLGDSVGTASLVGGNLLLDTVETLLLVELGLLELERSLFELLNVLFGRLERRVLTDSLVGRGVDLLNVVRTNVISEVGRELLLESVLSV
jgi:hypothetical protein